jgi:hypothetical protein
MRRMKSTTRRQQTVAASSFSSKDDFLGADHEEAPKPTCDATSCSAVSQRRGGVLHSDVNSPASTRHNGRMTFQCRFV